MQFGLSKNVSNPYPIKWIGFKIQKYGFEFKINPFKWIKTNIDLDPIWIGLCNLDFFPPLPLMLKIW